MVDPQNQNFSKRVKIAINLGLHMAQVICCVKNRSYKPTEKTVVGSPYGASHMSGQGEQQQQQPVNHNFENAETARCLAPFSHLVYMMHLQP